MDNLTFFTSWRIMTKVLDKYETVCSSCRADHVRRRLLADLCDYRLGPQLLCQNLPWTCESRALFQGGDDQKVVNFEQILFANGRMLDLTEAPAQRVRGLQFDF
jgi:hypothetical protein